jgi:hypothetical protein
VVVSAKTWRHASEGKSRLKSEHVLALASLVHFRKTLINILKERQRQQHKLTPLLISKSLAFAPAYSYQAGQSIALLTSSYSSF